MWFGAWSVASATVEPEHKPCSRILHSLQRSECRCWKDQALKIYNGFNCVSTESNRTVAEIVEKLDQFAIGEINEIYKRYVFNNRNQHESETFESYLATLCTLIKLYKYCDNCIESLLRDRIVLGIRDASTQKLLLRERDLTLNKTIDICKATESAVTQEKFTHLKS